MCLAAAGGPVRLDGAVRHARRPADDQRKAVEPARVQADHDRREGLQDPDPAEQLQVDRERLVQRDSEAERADLHDERRQPRHPGLLGRGGVRPEELLVDVAGEQVGRRDRHDRRRHQRPDDDRRVADPGEPAREHVLEQQRHRQLGVAPARLDPRVHRRRRPGQVAEQRDQPEHQRVSGQHGRVAPDHVAPPGGQHPGDRVRVHEQRQRRAQRQGGVGPLPGGQHDQAAVGLPRRRVHRGQMGRGGAEDVGPAAEPGRDVQDRDDHRDVDQRVLDERDQRRGAQPGQVGVRGDHHERDDQRQVPDEHAARRDADAHDGQHRLDADQLQRDVRHGGQDPGHGHRQPEPL